jgi:hypothetical protein
MGEKAVKEGENSGQKQLPLLKTDKVLKPRERKFWKAFLETGNQTEAYKIISPGVTQQSAEVGGSRMMKRILEKLDDPDYLDELGMGKPRVLTKLNELLDCQKAMSAGGGGIAHVRDNATQFQAVKLLAEINKMTKPDGGDTNIAVGGNNKIIVVPGKLSEDEWQRRVAALEEDAGSGKRSVRNVTGTGETGGEYGPEQAEEAEENEPGEG